MPDNVDITAGTGTTVATDQLAGGEHVQLIKLLDGAADSAARIGGDAANGLDVDVTRVQGTVTVAGAVTATLPAGTNNIGDVDVAPAATATLSSVNDTASSVSLLASNASRKLAIIHNDSTEILYVKLGTTASATSYTYRVAPQGTVELPLPCYTGAIDGIWANDASGAARITELT